MGECSCNPFKIKGFRLLLGPSSPDKVTNKTHALKVCVFRCRPIGKDEEHEGFGKIQASIRECFSLSAAKAPDKVTNEAHAVVPFKIFYCFTPIIRA